MSKSSDFFKGGGGFLIGSIQDFYQVPILYEVGATTWLKTGNLALASEYPDAGSALSSGVLMGILADWTGDFAGDTHDMVQIGGFIWVLEGAANIVHQYETTNYTLTGLTYSLSAGGWAGMDIDTNGDIVVWGNFGGKYHIFDTTGSQVQGDSISTGYTPNNVGGAHWDGTFWWVSEFVNDTVYQFNASYVYTGFSFATTSVANPFAMGTDYTDSNVLLILNSDGDWYDFNKTTGIRIGVAINTANSPVTGAGFVVGDGNVLQITTSDELHLISHKLEVVGITTAKTNSDSGQPLYVRIK